MELKGCGIIWITDLEKTYKYIKNEGYKTMKRIGFYSHDVVIMYMNNTNIDGHLTSIKIGSLSYHIHHWIENYK